jgi:hypothetical protein
MHWGETEGGKVTFRRVVEYVQEEMKGMGFGGLKLLSSSSRLIYRECLFMAQQRSFTRALPSSS